MWGLIVNRSRDFIRQVGSSPPPPSPLPFLHGHGGTAGLLGHLHAPLPCQSLCTERHCTELALSGVYPGCLLPVAGPGLHPA